jgi:uncharacterized protein (TIGR02246 family)
MSDLVTVDCGVRQLQARMIDAVWRQDDKDFSECFTRDGEWKIAGMHFRGREQIAEACRNLLGRCEKIQLIAMPTILQLEDDGTAVGRHHMMEFAKMADGTSAMTIGIYYDRFAEEDGRWRYRWHHWSTKYRGPTDLSAAFIQSSDYGSFPTMPGPDEPTWTRPAA